MLQVMPKRERQITWLELGVRNGGIRAAMTAATWAYTWAVTREALGHDPSVDEVADWWNTPRRTAFREQAAFRKAYPMLDNPAPIYASDEARAGLAMHAAFGDKLDKWASERRKGRATDPIKAVVLAARI